MSAATLLVGNVSLPHVFGWGYEDSALVGWICFGFRFQALLISAPIAGLILLDLVAYILTRTLHISARRVRVRAAASPLAAMIALPPSPPLLPSELGTAETIKLEPLSATVTTKEPAVVLGAPIVNVVIATEALSLTSAPSVNPSPTSSSSTTSTSSSAEWTHVRAEPSAPPNLVSYGSAFSGVSSRSSSSSVSSASGSPVLTPLGLGLSGTDQPLLSSVAVDPASAMVSDTNTGGSSRTHRRTLSSLAFSSIPEHGPETTDDDDDDGGRLTPTSSASSPGPSRMTTPGLRHRALPPLFPLSGLAPASGATEGVDGLELAAAAARTKHSRARAASIGVEGPLGFDVDEEEEDESDVGLAEDDRRIDSSDIVAGDFSSPRADVDSAGLRRRTTLRT